MIDAEQGASKGKVPILGWAPALKNTASPACFAPVSPDPAHALHPTCLEPNFCSGLALGACCDHTNRQVPAAAGERAGALMGVLRASSWMRLMTCMRGGGGERADGLHEGEWEQGGAVRQG